MTALAEQETLLSILVEDARTKPTAELTAIYRQGLDLADGNPALVPWHDAMDAVRVVLRERIAADWLHRRWCATPECHLGGHEGGAREVVAAFESGQPGALSEAVCRGLWPDTPVTARAAAYVAACAPFGALLARLVEVVPSEVTA